MRIRPSKLERDKFDRGQYHRHRYGRRVAPEWWTSNPGNVWDFIIGNMYPSFDVGVEQLQAKHQRRVKRFFGLLERAQRVIEWVRNH